MITNHTELLTTLSFPKINHFYCFKQYLKYLLKICLQQTMHLTIYFNPYPAKPREWLAFAISIEPGQTAHPCSLTRLYTGGWPTSSFHLDIPKMITDSSENVRLIILFKKFGMVWGLTEQIRFFKFFCFLSIPSH